MNRLFALASALVLLALPAFSQTNPTGTISGKVVDQQSLAVPGAIVTVQSPALQGTRSATSSVNGDYIIPFLPPGDYTVTLEMSGFGTVKSPARVAIGQTATIDFSLALSTLTETLEVTAETTADFGQKAQVVDQLQAGADREAAARPDLPGRGAADPGRAEHRPAGRARHLRRDVVPEPVHDQRRGRCRTTSAARRSTSSSRTRCRRRPPRRPRSRPSSAASAAASSTRSPSPAATSSAGRSALTFENDDWTALTPYPGDKRSDDVIPTYEATLGGPILKDKLWFFGAARLRDFSEARRPRRFTLIDYGRRAEREALRGQAHLLAHHEAHLQGRLQLDRHRTENGNSFGHHHGRGEPGQPRAAPGPALAELHRDRQLELLRRGAVLQPSSSSRTRARSSPTSSRARCCSTSRAATHRYNRRPSAACATTRSRDNQNSWPKASYFLSTASAGSHNFVGGVDLFDDKRIANNHQSGSDYRVYATSAIIQGETIFPVLDSRTFIRWTPIFEEQPGQPLPDLLVLR